MSINCSIFILQLQIVNKKLQKNRLGQTDKLDIVFLSKFNYERLDFFPKICYHKYMTQKYKPYTISELVMEIYEDNLSHFEFEEAMGGEPCDCNLHITMNTIIKYWE
jgi:hypothetical protein